MDTQHLVSYGLLLLCCFYCKQTYGLQTYYMDDLCNRYAPTNTIRVASSSFGGLDSSGIIKATRSNAYPSNFNCCLTLMPSSDNQIMIAVRLIDFRLGCIDKLILSGGYGIIQVKKEYCSDYSDTTESTVFETLGTSWSVNFTTSALDTITYRGFELIFTAYRNPLIYGSCYSGEYQCRNFKCVSKTLTCDGHNHCGDGSDKTACDGDGGFGRIEQGNASTAVITACVAVAVLLILSVAGIAYAWNRRSVSAATVFGTAVSNGSIVHPPPPPQQQQQQQQPYHINLPPQQPPHSMDFARPSQGNYQPQEKYPPVQHYQPPPPYTSNVVQNRTLD